MTTPLPHRGPGPTDPREWKHCAVPGCCWRFRTDADRVLCGYHAELQAPQPKPYNLRTHRPSANPYRHAQPTQRHDNTIADVVAGRPSREHNNTPTWLSARPVRPSGPAQWGAPCPT